MHVWVSSFGIQAREAASPCCKAARWSHAFIIDLGEKDVMEFDLSGSYNVLEYESLAVATPKGIELKQKSKGVFL
ncbi:hypothetical protein VNO78_22480 [Psophocarpus tetragonolobus]|uniref:Uncharacterized protein n=1 Tax=Psophocarpus tetragonolobus TaxID=3891 RepID=A0AAN9XBZ6_PSOTE